MQSTYKIVNRFVALNNDLLPITSDNKSYSMALNAVKGVGADRVQRIMNEWQNVKSDVYTGVIVGRAIIEERDWVLFLMDTSEVGYFNFETEKYTPIARLNGLSDDIKDPCGTGKGKKGTAGGCGFNFGGCEWVNIEYNFWNACNELHIEFSKDCTYYTLNVDAFADPARRAVMTCSELKTFKCDCIPTIRGIALEGGGAGLPNGKYRFVVRLYDADGHKTNFFNISNNISIGGGKNKPGEPSNEYIRLFVEGINCRYSTMEIAVIKMIDGTTSPYIVDRIGVTSSVSWEYHGDNGREIAISLDEITTKKVNFLEGRAIKIHDNRAFYYQLKNEKNFNIQKYADVISITLPVYRVPADIAHKYQGLQQFERYLLGIVGQYCDGTQTRVGVISGGGSLERRSTGSDEEPDLENPSGGGSGGGGGSEGGGSGGGGAYETKKEDSDKYLPYDELPTDHNRVQIDGYYDIDGNPLIKKHIDDTDALWAQLDTAGNARECLECGADGLGTELDILVGSEDGGQAPCPDTGGRTLVSNLHYQALISSNPTWANLVISQLEYDALSKDCPEGSSSTKSVKDQMKEYEDKLKKEQVYVPERVEVKMTNSKEKVKSGSNTFNPGGTFGEQYDGINIYRVGHMTPKWFASKQTYPETRDCSGGHIYGLHGKQVLLMEVPSTKPFENNTVGVKSAKSMGVDETSGFVYMVGIEMNNLPGVLPASVTGKPLCEEQPWKGVYIPRDALNSRVIGSGILINTMLGDVDGTFPHAIPRHGVNSRENIDRYIQKGGDDHNHEGTDGDGTLYTYLSPDALLGKIPLVANKFIKTHDLTGDGWRHGLYEESKKDVGFTGSRIDYRGCRETISLHTATEAYAEADILGICYAKGDSRIEAPPGIDVPLCNLGRESTVYLKLSAPLGDFKDKSFIADGLNHWSPVYEAKAAYGHLIKEMDMQYGSLINASYTDLGLYSKGNSRSMGGLVGDAHVGPFSVRRTSYVSNRVGDNTFVPSPRHNPAFPNRFFGFGDPSEPPEYGDKRDPKNLANRYPGQTAKEAANGSGNGSVYYPGTLTCLVYFFCESRVNAHYRQRGEEDWQVHARNLGSLHLDPAVPIGGDWEKSWLTQWGRKYQRISKLLLMLVPAIRIGIIIGLPFFVLLKAMALNSLFDAPFAIARGILYGVTYIVAIMVLSPSRLYRMLGVKDERKDREGGADAEGLLKWHDQYCKYNSDYDTWDGIAPSLGIPEPFNVCECDKCSEFNYYRPGGVPTKGTSNIIRYSARQYRGTEINAFTDVLEGDYDEMPGSASFIQSLFSLNNNLYAISSDGIHMIQYNGDAEYQGLDYLLGNGRALGSPQRFNEGVKQGSWGTVDPNSMEVTPYGLVYVDAKDSSINIFNGGAPEKIGDSGIFDLSKKYIPFCNSGSGCRDQKIRGVWYSIGYDPDYKRILITKSDGAAGGSWTLSYYPETKEWISAHSYVPSFYLWSRNKFFSVKENGIWRHNNRSRKQYFYGHYQPFRIWFTSVWDDMDAEHVAKTFFTNLEIHAEADDISGKMPIYNRDETFNMGAWSTSYQTTGLMYLDTAYYKCQIHKEIRKKNLFSELKRIVPGVWRFNGLKDHIKNNKAAIYKKDDCSFFQEIDDSNVLCGPGGDGKGSNMGDLYLNHMLTLDDPAKSNLELKLIKVVTYGKKPKV